MTPEQRDNAACYVIMSGVDSAVAVCVIDGSPKKMVQKFLAENVGGDIRRVNVTEARRLLTNHFAKGQERQEPEQLDLMLETEATAT